MNLSPAQQKALDEARALLFENFESYCVTLRATDENGDFDIKTFWEGSMPEAIGLARLGAIRMEEVAMRRTDFGPVDEEDEP